MNVLTRTLKTNKLIITSIFNQSYKLVHGYEIPNYKRYPTVYDKKSEENLNLWQRAKKGYSQLKEESNLFVEEQKDSLQNELLKITENEVNVIWRFNGDPKNLNKWLTLCDSDYNEGYSTCSFELTSQGTALFSGNLNCEIPKDGKITKAGYCILRTTTFRKSFKRKTKLDWEGYNHLVMRIRGDGRNYMINIGNKNYFDISWRDIYNYVIFTRGGPYWQYVKIPFSKFFLSSNGKIQDKQKPISLHRITSFGIMAADKIPGPFKIEIDYIGLEFDIAETEEFAYELYNYDKIMF